jgi:hypothetical protein
MRYQPTDQDRRIKTIAIEEHFSEKEGSDVRTRRG